MSITTIGIEGEQLARKILKNNIRNLENLFQLDWIYKSNNKYYCVEVKNKRIFEGPPFDGYGLNLNQLNARLDFFKTTSIRCLFLCICEQHNCIYYRWIDELANCNKFVTKNKIVIFSLDKFYKINKNKLKM